MVISTKFMDFVIFGTWDLGHNGKKFKNIYISINHQICPIFHAENNLLKLKFNFAHFIGPVLTLRGPAPFKFGTTNNPVILQIYMSSGLHSSKFLSVRATVHSAWMLYQI
jgi:hypothetical protein